MQRRKPHSGREQGRSRLTIADARRARVRRLRRLLREHDLGALLVANPNDIRYLTGFSGDDSALIVLERSLIMVSDFRFEEELQNLPAQTRLVIRSTGLFEAVGQTLRDTGVDSIGVQAEHLTILGRREIARRAGARRLVDAPPLLATLRAVKDDFEICAIRNAVRVQEQALLATLEQAAPGMMEREIAAHLEYEMKVRGAEGVSFPTIVAAGASGSLPHYSPARRRTGRNKALLIDWGARVDGYCADMTRTVAFGRWPARIREIYSVVLDAMDAAVEAVRPNIRAREIDRVARGIIEAAGYGPRFGHGLGHGIGLDVHEAPRVSRLSEDTLLPGMVITIEPGVYIPGVGGVRIEDDVLVTERGARRLASLPRDLTWATR
jgi:Xaa-Pro aminopeptidase